MYSKTSSPATSTTAAAIGDSGRRSRKGIRMRKSLALKQKSLNQQACLSCWLSSMLSVQMPDEDSKRLMHPLINRLAL